MFMGEETQGVDHLRYNGYLKSFHVLITTVFYTIVFTNRMIFERKVYQLRSKYSKSFL